MDILDTSFIRGTKKPEILAIVQSRRVGVSPYTVWEILCHLDEIEPSESAEQAFQRRKGHVVILQAVPILDDPFAQHSSAVGAERLTNPTRSEDRDMARQIIDRVVASASLAELDKEVFTYPNGAKAHFKDISSRARAALQQEEISFIANMRTMWDRVRTFSNIQNPSQLTEEALWEWLSAMLTALKQSYEKDGLATQSLLLKVAASMYVYYGYLFGRLRTYSKTPGGDLGIQPNDTEDGYICMHLRLFEDDAIVTGEKKTVRAVQSAIDLWNRKVPTLPAKCRAILTSDYLKAYSSLRFARIQEGAKTLDERRRERAYYSWINRGRPTGDDWSDWFEATTAIRD